MFPEKYSFGIGDRFGHQGASQINAIIEAGKKGIDISPVWNKSNREHIYTGTDPSDVRREADETTRNSAFRGKYFVDADHIGFDTVDKFIQWSDWFTIDVVSFIGTEAESDRTEEFLSETKRYLGDLKIEGIAKPYIITPDQLRLITSKYLNAMIKAGEIYRKIRGARGGDDFAVEISIDEVSTPQKPADLFFILLMLAKENIPLSTIAPRFHGKFNKGVDFEGDVNSFAAEFEQDILVLDRAVKEFGLPDSLKLSVHSGSDKFSIYPRIGRIIMKHNKGIHIKTAGTTWLEEVAGLAMAGGEAQSFARKICVDALGRKEELCLPYKGVIEIDERFLPSQKDIEGWTGAKLSGALRHIPGSNDYNPHFRQLVHVAYKIAAERKEELFNHLENNSKIIDEFVFDNLYHRHISKIFDIR